MKTPDLDLRELILLRHRVTAMQEWITRELRAMEERISRLIPPEETSRRRRVTRRDLERAARKGGKR
ncbi:MAG: hypothetical protein JRJ09_18825 [Deltaproteobacteria bacterium]|nr:hypothetical protein [Deltaproteobacteria bacterium]